MALIKCKECGKEISNTASFCPHCGCNGLMQEINNKTAIKIIITIFTIFFISLFVLKVIL